MVSEDRRQTYPVGDLDFGQLVQAEKALPTVPQVAEWLQHESITVSTTAVGLDEAYRTIYNYALITVIDEAVRFWLDGTDPTASVGHVLADGSSLTLESAEELRNFRVIEVTGTPILSVSYGRRTDG